MKPRILKYEDLKDFVEEKVYVVYVDMKWNLNRHDLMNDFHTVKKETDDTFDLYDKYDCCIGNAKKYMDDNRVLVFSYQPLTSELIEAYNRRFN